MPDKFNLPSEHKYETLPLAVREWLESETVMMIIFDINDKLKTVGPEGRIITRLITRLVLGMVKPEDFTDAVEFYNTTSATKPQLIETATTIKTRILKPIRSSLKELGIDIEKIPTAPDALQHDLKARVMDINNTPTPIKSSSETPKPRPAQPPAVPSQPPVPKARIMEMKQVIDVRKPLLRPTGSAGQAPGTTPAVAKPAPEPTAQTMNIEGDFSAGAAVKAVAPTPKSAGPAPAKKPEGESDVLETKKEFGLAEVVPKPPQPQELEKYEDHHPTVD